MATTQFEAFKKTLKKVFMLDQAELDFGIYRIMNQKRNDIEKYLNENLKAQVVEILEKNKSSQVTDLENELKETVKAAEKFGMLPDDMPKVKELKAKIAASGNTEELENEVYSHLTTFFSRYYDGGDFISQRRYKKDVYAIPYEGEEVKLYWANADQYYIKTSEYFRNYRFKLDCGKYVEFTLKEASTEQNNNKAQNNMERRFALYEECPVEVINDELHINFTYELYPKATKQKALIDAAYTNVKDSIPAEFKMELLAFRPTENDKYRTLLQKHLTDYVARNTFDYFIHKDLKGFLSRELDFYIKNEILEIDDIDARTTESFLAHLTVIKAIKNVGSKIIEFLASLENFQKRLWLKKKMVVSADYCITLDRVPEKLYAEICANDAQREEWVKLFAIDEIKSSQPDGFFKEGAVTGYSVPLTEQFLKENPFLVLDTAFFTDDFKHKLISEIDDLDEKCDGLLINSENFQALNLLQEKYRNSIKCVYIDPPYNTGSDNSFAYKDSFLHSSWAAMMKDRAELAKYLMNKYSTIWVSTDDGEYANLKLNFDTIFGENNFLCDIIWNSRKSVSSDAIVSGATNHTTLFAKYKDVIKENKEDFKIDANEEGFINPDNDPKGPWKLDPMDAPGLRVNLSYGITNNLSGQTYYPASGRHWRFEEKDVIRLLGEGRILFGKTGNAKPAYKRYKFEAMDKGDTITSLWDDVKTTADGTKLLLNIFGESLPKEFIDQIKPKPVEFIDRIINVSTKEDDIIMDYFCGSATTAHAAINRSRTGHKSRYVLCDMNNNFNILTKPRIQKVIYSEDWNNGKPVSRKGSSHCFKYMRLEQYEDTLNNLVVRKNSFMDNQSGEFFDGYMLGYLLDTETKDSLFSLEWFINPWNTKLKITRNNETKEEKVDLVETFNYLIGLNVQKITYPKSDICVVEGYNRKNEHILIIWRDCIKVSNKALNEFFKKMAYSTRDREFDRVYVNGDNNLENLKTDADTWKVTLIEQEFSKKMFEEE